MTPRSFTGFALGGLLFLAGCGGDDAGAPVGQAGNAGGGPADAFTAQVQSVTATLRDDLEPANVDNLSATMPEDTEPFTF